MRLRTKKRLLNCVAAFFLITGGAILTFTVLNDPTRTTDQSAGFDEVNLASDANAVTDDNWSPDDFRDLLKIRLQGRPVESKPVAEQRPVMPQPTVELPSMIVLKGILFHPQHALAMFQLRGENRTISCAPGEEIRGAQIKHISADEVILSYRGKDFTQRLETRQ